MYDVMLDAKLRHC